MNQRKSGTYSKDTQLSLFDEAEGRASERPEHRPVWHFEHEEDVDYIADEPVTAHLYHLQDIKDISRDYEADLFREVLFALIGLADQRTKQRRDCKFTVFCGTVPGRSTYAICIATQQEDVLEHLAARLRGLPGWYLWQEGLSTDFNPIFRYDTGSIIQYVTDETGGTTIVDGNERFGTGATMHRRRWKPAEAVGSTVSIYARRINHQAGSAICR